MIRFALHSSSIRVHFGRRGISRTETLHFPSDLSVARRRRRQCDRCYVRELNEATSVSQPAWRSKEAASSHAVAFFAADAAISSGACDASLDRAKAGGLRPSFGAACFRPLGHWRRRHVCRAAKFEHSHSLHFHSGNLFAFCAGPPLPAPPAAQDSRLPAGTLPAARLEQPSRRPGPAGARPRRRL